MSDHPSAEKNFEPCYCEKCDGKLPAPCRYGTGSRTSKKQAADYRQFVTAWLFSSKDRTTVACEWPAEYVADCAAMIAAAVSRESQPPAVPREWIEGYAQLLTSSLHVAALAGVQGMDEQVAQVRARQREVDAWLKTSAHETTAPLKP